MQGTMAHARDFVHSDAPLSSTASILPNLISLELTKLRIHCFCATMASSLICLTSLDLSTNWFTQLPTAVSQITTLKKLNMSHNHELQLTNRDLNLLAALSQLRLFDISNCKDLEFTDWSQESIHTVIAIKSRMPSLVVHGLL